MPAAARSSLYSNVYLILIEFLLKISYYRKEFNFRPLYFKSKSFFYLFEIFIFLFILNNLFTFQIHLVV